MGDRLPARRICDRKTLLLELRLRVPAIAVLLLPSCFMGKWGMDGHHKILNVWRGRRRMRTMGLWRRKGKSATFASFATGFFAAAGIVRPPVK